MHWVPQEELTEGPGVQCPLVKHTWHHRYMEGAGRCRENISLSQMKLPLGGQEKVRCQGFPVLPCEVSPRTHQVGGHCECVWKMGRIRWLLAGLAGLVGEGGLLRGPRRFAWGGSLGKDQVGPSERAPGACGRSQGPALSPEFQ